jgi:hypothetical protein
MVYLEHPTYLEVDRRSRPFSLYKWFKKLQISRTQLSQIPRLSRSVFMVPNPNFTLFISKFSHISGLFNIHSFVTSPIYTLSHLHPFIICATWDAHLFEGVPGLLINLTAWLISSAVVHRTKVKLLIIYSLARYRRWYSLFHYFLLLTPFSHLRSEKRPSSICLYFSSILDYLFPQWIIREIAV